MKTLIQTDRFSSARFKAVLKNDLLTKRKTAFFVVIGFYVFLLTFFSLTVVPFCDFAGMAENLRDLFSLSLFITSSVMASLIMHECTHKGERINVIMLPAKNFEKFLSRIITVLFYGIIISTAIYLILYYILIGLHLAFQSGTTIYDDYLTPFENINQLTIAYYYTMDMTQVRDNLMYVFTIIWTLTFYLLGGFLWKKRSWLVTSCILFALIICMSGSFILLQNENISISINIRAINFTFSLVLAMLAVFNVWLSYRVFCRMQVTSGKLINIRRLFKRK